MATDSELFDAYGDLAHGIARSFFLRTPPKVELDDLNQAALIGLWLASETHDPGRGHFKAWAVLVIRREVVAEIRRTIGRGEPGDNGRTMSPLHNAGALPRSLAALPEVDTVELVDTANEIVAAMADSELTQREATALLAQVAGTPSQVVADRLGTTVGSLGVSRHSARKKLKRTLSEHSMKLKQTDAD